MLKTTIPALLFALALFILPSFSLTLAQEDIPITGQVAGTEVKTVEEPLSTPSAGYTFPYPGILPDHPLYSLKVLRDKVYDMFLKDPVKKVEFKLLMADKRMNMAQMLTSKGNNSLAVETIVDATKYYKQAVDLFISIDSQKTPTNGLGRELIEAGEAYPPIITEYIHAGNIDSFDVEKLTDAYNVVTISSKTIPE